MTKGLPFLKQQVSSSNKQPEVEVARKKNQNIKINPDFSFLFKDQAHTVAAVPVMCANAPVEMLAHMLKVSEDWLPTKPRLMGADRQRQNMPTAQFSVWPIFLSLFSFYSLTPHRFPSRPSSAVISFFPLHFSRSAALLKNSYYTSASVVCFTFFFSTLLHFYLLITRQNECLQGSWQREEGTRCKYNMLIDCFSNSNGNHYKTAQMAFIGPLQTGYDRINNNGRRTTKNPDCVQRRAAQSEFPSVLN